MSYDPLSEDNDIGLGDEDKDRVKTGKVEWYKGEKGRTDRVSFIYFHNYDLNLVKKALRQNPKLDEAGRKKISDDCREMVAKKLGKAADQLTAIDMLDLSECKFKVSDVHFKEGPGFGYLISRLGKDGEAADEIWRKLPQAKTTVTTCLVVYPTTREGDLIKENLSQTKVLPWKFSGEKWDTIRRINKGLLESGHTIGEYDLNFACSETQYQKILISQSGPDLWRKNPEFTRMVLTKAVAHYDKLLPGRAITTDELRERFGMSPAAGAGGSADVSGIDFSEVLNGV